jgi:hypothetical protein
MSKPYVYLSAGDSRDITRRIGDGARVSFHGTGDGSRSLSVYVDGRGIWDVEHSPGPVHGGERVQVVRGCLPGEFSERFGDPVQVTVDPWERAVNLSEIRRKLDALETISKEAERMTPDDLGLHVLGVLEDLKASA